MLIQVIYLSIVFVFGLFCLAKIMTGMDTFIDLGNDTYKAYCIMAVCFIVWCAVNVLAGISSVSFVDYCLLMLTDYLRFMFLVAGIELCAIITNRRNEPHVSHGHITSELLYLGFLMMVVRLIFDRGAVSKGIFGDYIQVSSNISVITYVFFNVVIVFFYGAYTYTYYYSCAKKREHYVCSYLIAIIAVLIVSLIAEVIGLIYFKTYIPSMLFAFMAELVIFRNLIVYKKSIVYDERDYEDILAPSHGRPAFVCDDTGRVIFENTRAFVLAQTMKDVYEGRYLTDIFEISDFDKGRLLEPRITQSFEVYCKYGKEKADVMLKVRHKLDRFSEIFASEVEYYAADAINDLNDNDVAEAKESATVNVMRAMEISVEDINVIRSEVLLNQIKAQKDLYEKGNKELFLFNLKGISKSAALQGNTSLEELCSRIQTEIVFGEWESLDSMLIELDRQYETLKMITL